MNRRDSVLGEHCESILAVAAANKATSIALVGSVARAEDAEDSDYDVLVTFAKGASLLDLAHLELALEEMLSVDVDVISTRSLEPMHADMFREAIAL